jgi:hypothetical protein
MLIDLFRPMTISCVYYRHIRKGEADEEITIFILYVDDELSLSSNKAVLNEMMEFLGKEIDVRSIPPDRFIGIDINRNRIQRTIHLSQPDYVETVLERFNMINRSTLSFPADPCAKLPPQMCPQRCDNQGAIALIRDPVFPIREQGTLTCVSSLCGRRKNKRRMTSPRSKAKINWRIYTPRRWLLKDSRNCVKD